MERMRAQGRMVTGRRLGQALALMALVGASGLGGAGCGGAGATSDAGDDLMSDATTDTSWGDGGALDEVWSQDVPPTQDVPVEPPEGVRLIMDPSADLRSPEHFFDYPWPADVRLADGHPDVRGFPLPDDLTLMAGVVAEAGEHAAWPVQPVAWFRFDGALAPRDPADVLPAGKDQPILLVDVGADSPNRGKLTPVVAKTLEEDRFTPANVLAVAPRPGFVLRGGHTYAFVVRRGAGAADGSPLGVPERLWALSHSYIPPGDEDELAPLWPVLDTLGVPRDDVAAATVFTTGDVIADLYALTEGLRARDHATIQDLAVDPDDGADHARYCELHGTLTLPQYQQGTPPFNAEGLFELGADGLPVVQRTADVPIVLTIPKAKMPPAGWPLVLYFHGSGGLSTQVVDRGPKSVPDGPTAKGMGPAHVLAGHGFAAVGAALPVNPERVPGAGETAYLNFSNLAAFRDTFRQGIIEQRMMLDALLALEIPPETVAACGPAPQLPPGATAHHFHVDAAHPGESPVFAMGQSMGGMYANLITAVEPRIRAVVPTGAGGYWSYFILITHLLNAKPLLAALLDTEADLTFLHPMLHMLQTAWETAEPMVAMPRLAQRPLPGHPVRAVYDPVGQGDHYFPTELYDAVALAYGHRQAGDEIWPTMQDALKLAGLEGLLSYPVTDDVHSEDGTPYTGVIAQYEGDGVGDPHEIFAQLPGVMHQYGCFLETFRDTGHATLVAPAAEDAPCQ